jgi:hypothetical protein
MSHAIVEAALQGVCDHPDPHTPLGKAALVQFLAVPKKALADYYFEKVFAPNAGLPGDSLSSVSSPWTCAPTAPPGIEPAIWQRWSRLMSFTQVDLQPTVHAEFWLVVVEDALAQDPALLRTPLEWRGQSWTWATAALLLPVPTPPQEALFTALRRPGNSLLPVAKQKVVDALIGEWTRSTEVEHPDTHARGSAFDHCVPAMWDNLRHDWATHPDPAFRQSRLDHWLELLGWWRRCSWLSSTPWVQQVDAWRDGAPEPVWTAMVQRFPEMAAILGPRAAWSSGKA